MVDIFVSYSREDSVKAERLSARLKQMGWTVWWDDRLRPGDAFDVVIETEITRAKTVLVLWSAHSVTSVWVKAEATIAQQHNKLVPILIEPARIPMPFGAFHTADLSNWDGASDDPNLLELLSFLSSRDAGTSDLSAEYIGERTEWQATLLKKEPAKRRFQLRNGTRRHELECLFRPNFLLNRFVLTVDGYEVAKGGHQFRDSITIEFPIDEDWTGSASLASGDSISSGSCLGYCVISIGGRVLYRESEDQ